MPDDPAQPVRIARSRECISCGFDIVGLDPARVCPECGTPLARTLGTAILADMSVPNARRVVVTVWLLGLGLLSLILCIGLFVGTLVVGSFWEGAMFCAVWFGALSLVPGTVGVCTSRPVHTGVRLALPACYAVALLLLAGTMPFVRGIASISSRRCEDWIYPFIAASCVLGFEALTQLASLTGRTRLIRRVRWWRCLTRIWFAGLALPVIVMFTLRLPTYQWRQASPLLDALLSYVVPFGLLGGHAAWLVGSCVLALWTARAASRQAPRAVAPEP